MTIRLPPDTIVDKFLKLFGIQRKITLPKDNNNLTDQNPYVTIMAEKENIFTTLLRVFRN